ncbi:MAG: SMC-Scp complex subunit ScpB [Spirochaetales bacterium]|nr:SMC-Scp complex subunit ScpB [Spirochaetales bacterium]
MQLLDKQAALIEAILFLEADAVSETFLVKASGLAKSEVQDALTRLKQIYGKNEHGLELVSLAGGYMFAPKKQLWELLKTRYGKKAEARLSRAALETLAIIAYSQPITRSEIESIRGVSSDAMVKLLLSREFIKEVGKKDVPGKPLQYGTTKAFLRHFNLKSISDLPKLDEVERRKFELR